MRRLLAFGLWLPTIALLPVLVNVHLRFQYLQTLAHYASKVRAPDFVFLGDSITAGGRSWGWRIKDNPLDSINLGQNGLTISQIAKTFPQAEQYHAEIIFVMAGTNDILADAFNLPQFEQEYSVLIDRGKKACDCLGSKGEVIFTQLPMTANSGINEKIKAANAVIKRLALDSNLVVIELNDRLAPDGVLGRKMTVDGIHFSDTAYDVWTERIEETLKRTNRPKCADYRPALGSSIERSATNGNSCSP